MNKRLKQIDQLREMVGNTPMLEIVFRLDGQVRKVYAKAESYNLTGSIKDRMAYHILRKAIEDNRLPEGATIIEATSGNTGIAFSAVGKAMGHPVTIFMPDWMSEERKNLMKSYGADVQLVSKEQGGFIGSIEKTVQLSKELPASFLPCQFSNEDNCRAHFLTTGPEIAKQLDRIDLTPSIFVAGVGTGGTVMGTGRYLRQINSSVKIHPLEPSNSPTMSTGYKVGKHRIQGISDEFIPDIVKLPQLDEIISVHDGDAIRMAQKLSKELGLGVGISSGANFIGAIMAAEKAGNGQTAVTVFSDDNKKYLSTDLMKEEPILEGFYSSRIELLEVNALPRAF